MSKPTYRRTMRASTSSSGGWSRAGSIRRKIPKFTATTATASGAVHEANTPRIGSGGGHGHEEGQLGDAVGDLLDEHPAGLAEAREHGVLEREHGPDHGAGHEPERIAPSCPGAARAGAPRGSRRGRRCSTRPARWSSAARYPTSTSRRVPKPAVGTKRLNPLVRFSCEMLERKSIVEMSAVFRPTSSFENTQAAAIQNRTPSADDASEDPTSE